MGQSATLGCTANVPVSTIELRDQSSTVLKIVVNKPELSYTIASVSSDLQGEQYTCTAVSEDSQVFAHTVEIQVMGRFLLLMVYAVANIICAPIVCLPNELDHLQVGDY